MRFLVDENLSPQVAVLLNEAGHEAAHVYDLKAKSASDDTIMVMAAAEERVIISADTDFGALLASNRATRPSVILVRELIHLRPNELVALLLLNLDVIAPDIDAGAIAAFGKSGIRVRPLPLR